MELALAPMEGLVDNILRDLLTRVGGIDWCVTEFIRVSDRALPPSSFLKLAPELEHGSRTHAGTPLHVQLLGSDPGLLGESAAVACELGAPVIDLNFGCPAKTVNRSKGGAVLLNEPELLHAIVSQVRRDTPAQVPVTAKMRLGYASPAGAMDCARALADGGAQRIVVHARTKLDGYKPPAHWEWVARVQDVVKVPVYANGEIWTVEDWRRCKAVSGAEHFMLGRGLVSCPDLALQIAAAARGDVLQPMAWDALLPLLRAFWRQAMAKLSPRYAPGRLKQWVAMLTRTYPEATALFKTLRQETDCMRISAMLNGRETTEV